MSLQAIHHIRHIRHTRVQCAMVAALALAVLVSGCQRPAPPTKQSEKKVEQPVKVEVGVVRAQLMKKTIDLPATIISDETAMLMARVEAYVAEVLVNIGDEVKAGQVLVRLDAPEFKHDVAEAQAAVQQILADEHVLQAEIGAAQAQLAVINAELALKSSERDQLAHLVSTGAINRQRLVEAESKVTATAAMVTKYKNAVKVAEANLHKGESVLAVAEAQLQSAIALMGYLEIKAPFAGIVAKRNVDQGNLVRPATASSDAKPMLTIAKVNTLRAVVHATTDVAGELNVGGAVTFIADDMPNVAFEGKLSRTAGSYDNKTRMMRAEMDIDNHPDPKTGHRPLRAGSYGSAEIVLYSETLPVVPESALRRSSVGTSVVLVRNRVCQIVPVEIALEKDGLVGITSGIEAGDQVVIKDAGALVMEQALKESEIDLVTW